MSDTLVYDFSADTIDGRTQPSEAYRGRLLLVVNTASACGLTPQFAGLEVLWKDLQGRGLTVIGFPSNEFAGQDPGSNDEIAAFCQKNYGVSFPMMAKVEVNGVGAHPLWQWMRQQAPGPAADGAIQWNFTKFLIGRDGRVLRRFEPTEKPEAMRSAIEAAL
ncbi:MAG: glutathione peroxidase [Betaproteobacteria bacterium]|jgi:glutathione peroxidase